MQHPLILALLLLTGIASSIVFVVSSTAGCFTTPPYSPGTSNAGYMLTADNRNRTFHVYVPIHYQPTTPTPVVFLFHGGFGNGANAEQKYGMDPVADNNTFIVVYPDGWALAWNAGLCCGLPRALNIDDIGFVSALLDLLESTLCIDTTRVFATGMSNGALMSQAIGCALSDRFAAIAPVEGTLEYYPCMPNNSVAIFEIHGTADMNIPFNGGLGCGLTGVNFTSVPATIDHWFSINDCSCPYASGSTCGTVTVQVGDGTCTQYGTCSKGGTTVLCVINGGGHTWPGVSSQIDYPSCNASVGQFPASQQIWSFFSTQQRGSTGDGSGAGRPDLWQRSYLTSFFSFAISWFLP